MSGSEIAERNSCELSNTWIGGQLSRASRPGNMLEEMSIQSCLHLLAGPCSCASSHLAVDAILPLSLR